MTTSVTPNDWFKHRPWIDEPNASVDAYVKSVAKIDDYDLKGKLEYWRECGIVIFEGAVDTATVDSLLDDVKYLIHHPKEFEITVETGGQTALPHQRS